MAHHLHFSILCPWQSFLTMEKNISFGSWIWLIYPLNPQYTSPFLDIEWWSQMNFFWNWSGGQEPCFLEVVPGITAIPEYASMAFSQLSLNIGCHSILLNTVSVNGGWMLVENYLPFLPRIFPTLLQGGPSKTNKWKYEMLSPPCSKCCNCPPLPIG